MDHLHLHSSLCSIAISGSCSMAVKTGLNLLTDIP